MTSDSGFGQFLLFLGSVIVAVLVGAATGEFALPISITTGLVIFMASASYFRSFVWDRFRLIRQHSADQSPGTMDSIRHSTSRRIYYLALLTSGFLIFRPMLGFTVSDWLFLGALVVALCEFALARYIMSPGLPRLFLFGVFVFLLGGFLSSLGAPSPMESMAATVKAFYLLAIWIWLSVTVLRTREHLATAVLFWSAGMALSAAGGLLQMQGIGEFWSPEAAWGRFTGGADHPNDLGAQCAIALVPAISLLWGGVVRWKRILLVAVVVLLGVGVLISGSVTGFAVAAGCAFLWFFTVVNLNVKSVSILIIGMLMAIGTYGWIATSEVATPLDRLSTNIDTSSQYCTSCSRAASFQLAVDAISDQPFIGHGLDSEGMRLSDRSVPHNMLVKAWYESGILGFLGLAMVTAIAALLSLRNLRLSNTERELYLSLGLFVSFVGFVVLGLAQPILYQRYAWFPVAFILVCSALSRKVKEELHIPISVHRSSQQTVMHGVHYIKQESMSQ